MGYTHYYYTAPEFNKEDFSKVATDFKKMIPVLKHLGVELGDGLGENHPVITPTKIVFNGLEKCGHTERDLGITWPSANAKGVSKNSVGTSLQELVNGSWFAGASLETRACGGDCSHETFDLLVKSKTEDTAYDGSTYKLEPQEDGTYFQCTKTAYKPYDLAVNICLIIAKHYLKENIQVHSDGTMNNWTEGMEICQHFLGYGKDFKLDEDED